jgi:hypothetical protein
MKEKMMSQWVNLFDDHPISVTNLPPDTLRGRYMEHAGQCTYSVWGGGKVETRYMHDDQLPDWLSRIVVAAKVGGHELWVSTPPPSMRLWFDMTPQRELIGFVDVSKHHVS